MGYVMMERGCSAYHVGLRLVTSPARPRRPARTLTHNTSTTTVSSENSGYQQQPQKKKNAALCEHMRVDTRQLC